MYGNGMPISMFSLSLSILVQFLAVSIMHPKKRVSPSDYLFGETTFFIKIRANSKLISAVLFLESQACFQG